MVRPTIDAALSAIGAADLTVERLHSPELTLAAHAAVSRGETGEPRIGTCRFAIRSPVGVNVKNQKWTRPERPEGIGGADLKDVRCAS